MAALRDQLYAIAGIAVTEYTANKARFASAVGALPENERQDAEERAGIMEFDGGLSRDQAERLAISDYARPKDRKKF